MLAHDFAELIFGSDHSIMKCTRKRFKFARDVGAKVFLSFLINMCDPACFCCASETHKVLSGNFNETHRTKRKVKRLQPQFPAN